MVAVEVAAPRAAAGRVSFAAVPPALRGGGMPPFDVDLVVARTDERVPVRRTLLDSDLGQAVSHSIETDPAPRRT
jgi:hypothetical protein